MVIKINKERCIMLFPEFSNMGIIDDNEDSMIEMEIGLK
jgi:hypothetical protein